MNPMAEEFLFEVVSPVYLLNTLAGEAAKPSIFDFLHWMGCKKIQIEIKNDVHFAQAQNNSTDTHTKVRR